jgi:N-acyl-phosphatidylethanolamine-hydrolysing phospholipase D
LDPKSISLAGISYFNLVDYSDTGYRSVADGQDEDTVPRCPVFRHIGQKYGSFDLARFVRAYSMLKSSIPIGAYSPRHIMSPIHCSPADSVLLHHDIRSKLSVGMHWGTFVLTDEPVNQPPHKLKEALAKNGKKEDEFVTINIGETMVSDSV